MITATVTDRISLAKVQKAIKQKFHGSGNPVQDIASRTRKRMAALFRTSRKPSRPGSPPHTRGKGKSIKNSIRYAVSNDGTRAVIGPDSAVIGKVAQYHEFGGRQPRHGKRREYAIGKVGPMDYRSGYSTPLKNMKEPLPGRENIAFGRIKTQRQLAWAKELDRKLWPDVETHIRYAIYPRRPFRQKTLDTLSKSVRETAVKWQLKIV